KNCSGVSIVCTSRRSHSIKISITILIQTSKRISTIRRIIQMAQNCQYSCRCALKDGAITIRAAGASHYIKVAIVSLNQTAIATRTSSPIVESFDNCEYPSRRDYKYDTATNTSNCICYSIRVSVGGSYQPATRSTAGNVVIKIFEDCKNACACNFKNSSGSVCSTTTRHSIKVTIGT